ncbi:MAG: DUF47 domain-containing protein [Candidatus Merdivicinus sp.]|jgi:predicted phosphate transport protein (TIGR00153 family)
MGSKRDFNYFEAFVQLVDYSCQSAEILDTSLKRFDHQGLAEMMTNLHGIEHAADMGKHDMMNRLAREFISPIEREDIIELGQEIDNVTDSIEDVLMGIYMYNIQTIRPEALDFVDVIVQCCNALKKTMEDFQNFRKSTTIHDSIVEINRLEEVGDRLYTEAVRSLYLNCQDPIETVSWTEIFDRLESCCDACEHVANVVESVIMKNT